MNKEYVTKIDGAYQITDSRVSLDSIVYAWRDGASPETIRGMFPVLTLEEVYGAITFYLGNQGGVDEHLRQNEIEFEEARQNSNEIFRQTKPELYRKLMAAKERRAKATAFSGSVHQ